MATVRPLKAAVAPHPPAPFHGASVAHPKGSTGVRTPASNTSPERSDASGGGSDRAAFAQAMNYPQRVRTPPAARPAASPAKIRPERRVQNTLDGSWDKKLGRGMVIPDSSIDLHGHTLASAHALLDQGLDRAIKRGDRVLLLVTGKPPRPESERPHARGAIRAAVADWLAASRFADQVAAVRGASPRHGGTGALYIVLRRARG